MKTKHYLLVKVMGNNNPLVTQRFKLSEAHFISQVAQSYPNDVLSVRLIVCDDKTYKLYFEQ